MKMSADLVPNVKSAVEAIIASEGYSSNPTIDVSPGSQVGDGFASKTLSISIKGSVKTTNLFVKYFPEAVKNDLADEFQAVFSTELRFYEEIFPKMLKFQHERGMKEEAFDNVPKHYKTGVKYKGTPPIVLENLRSYGYTLRDFREPIDNEHLTLALRTFAKYHATSYAMKDQEPDLFKEISADLKDVLAEGFVKFGMADTVGGLIDAFVNHLDPVNDKKLLNECRNLREILVQHVCSVNKDVDDYAVICQGDCWSNNMMFQYDEQTGSPIDIKLVDWQIPKFNSPVLDVSYFFYSVSTPEVLANFDKYFKLYYDTLADHIKKLGSDPRKLYPRVMFLKHWKKYAKFGLTMSFGAFKMQEMKKGEMPSFMDTDDFKMPKVANHFDDHSKIKVLVEHFIERDFL